MNGKAGSSTSREESLEQRLKKIQDEIARNDKYVQKELSRQAAPVQQHNFQNVMVTPYGIFYPPSVQQPSYDYSYQYGAVDFSSTMMLNELMLYDLTTLLDAQLEQIKMSLRKKKALQFQIETLKNHLVTDDKKSQMEAVSNINKELQSDPSLSHNTVVQLLSQTLNMQQSLMEKMVIQQNAVLQPARGATKTPEKTQVFRSILTPEQEKKTDEIINELSDKVNELQEKLEEKIEPKKLIIDDAPPAQGFASYVTNNELFDQFIEATTKKVQMLEEEFKTNEDDEEELRKLLDEQQKIEIRKREGTISAGRKRWYVLKYALLFMIACRKLIQKKKEFYASVAESMKKFMDVAASGTEAFFSKVVRIPIESLLAEDKVDLDILSSLGRKVLGVKIGGISEREREFRIIKIKAKVKAIIELISQAMKPESEVLTEPMLKTRRALTKMLRYIITPVAILPRDRLLPNSEGRYIDEVTEPIGRTKLSSAKARIMIIHWIITKTVVRKLLNSKKVPQKVKKNVQIISSLLYIIAIVAQREILSEERSDRRSMSIDDIKAKLLPRPKPEDSDSEEEEGDKPTIAKPPKVSKQQLLSQLISSLVEYIETHTDGLMTDCLVSSDHRRALVALMFEWILDMAKYVQQISKAALDLMQLSTEARQDDDDDDDETLDNLIATVDFMGIEAKHKKEQQRQTKGVREALAEYEGKQKREKLGTRVEKRPL